MFDFTEKNETLCPTCGAIARILRVGEKDELFVCADGHNYFSEGTYDPNLIKYVVPGIRSAPHGVLSD